MCFSTIEKDLTTTYTSRLLRLLETTSIQNWLELHFDMPVLSGERLDGLDDSGSCGHSFFTISKGC